MSKKNKTIAVAAPKGDTPMVLSGMDLLLHDSIGHQPQTHRIHRDRRLKRLHTRGSQFQAALRDSR